MVSLNSGEVKRVLMGSLAGPESPKPWSHNIKFRAMGFCSCEYDELGQKNRMNIMVPLKITVNRTIGFVNNIDSSLHFWSCFFYLTRLEIRPLYMNSWSDVFLFGCSCRPTAAQLVLLQIGHDWGCSFVSNIPHLFITFSIVISLPSYQIFRGRVTATPA